MANEPRLIASILFAAAPAAAPAAVAIGVFGMLYGAAARPLLGPEMTILSSVIVFSGALQFATIGLLAAGAMAPALLITAVVLNLRHLVLGAVLRPRLGASRLRRAFEAWFLLDESFGFAVAAGSDPTMTDEERTAATERTLVTTGVIFAIAWLVGTGVGVVGGGIPGVEGFAAAVFPVLFIGLAAIAVRDRSVVIRAIVAALLTAAIAVAVPEFRALAPVVAGLAVSLPGSDRAPSASPT